MKTPISKPEYREEVIIMLLIYKDRESDNRQRMILIYIYIYMKIYIPLDRGRIETDRFR
tara:strand:- start:943 stop:1119 length:177 start_codon:yes stop_codon:yes gene_type:complete